MDIEQEGIELETINLRNEDSIELPDVNDTVDEEELETDTEVTKKVDIDEEKESLKRGVNKERKARKEAEKRIKELEALIKSSQEDKTPKKTTVEELMETGVEENIAKSIAAAIDKKQSENSKLANQIAEIKFENSLTKKSKEDGFEDILDYENEIKELVDKGLTIEQSYYAVTYNKTKTQNTKSEIERKIEANIQNNQTRKNIFGNYNSSSGASANSANKLNISAEEKAVAAAAGMTPQEYVAVRDAKTAKEYKNYSINKK